MTDTQDTCGFTLAHEMAKNVILSRYKHEISEEDFKACELYSEHLGASLGHYLTINSPAVDVQFVADWRKGESCFGVVSFDLIGPRNNHVGRENVAKHLLDYLTLARAFAATAETRAPEILRGGFKGELL